MQALLAIRANDLGAHVSVAALKVGALNCMVQSFYSSVRSWDLGVSFQFYGTVRGMDFMVTVCFSFPAHLNVSIFLSHSTSFWFSHRENCSCTFGTATGREKC